MDQPFYSISELAQQAAVSVRTLRYYDQAGLLAPSHYSKAGYRLYTDEDMARLQYILALKFLGFSLEEIKICLQTGPKRLQEVLAQQKAMMLEKRRQVDAILSALEHTEQLLETALDSHNSIIKMIRVIQMEQKNAWAWKHLTPEQQQQMIRLRETSLSEEAKQKLAERGWSEADSKRHNEDYAHFRTELTRLVAQGADPAGPEGLALAEHLFQMNNRLSGGDPNVLTGMRKTWDNFNALPDDQKPTAYKIPDEEREFIKQASRFFHMRRAGIEPKQD